MESFSTWVAGQGQVILPLVGVAIVALSWILARSSPRRHCAGRIAVDTALLCVGLVAYALTYGFTGMSFSGASAEMVPRLWSGLLIVLAIVRLVHVWSGKDAPDTEMGRMDKVLLLMALLVAKVIGINLVGYYITAGVFVFACGLLFGYRNILTLVLLSGGWVAFSYFVFYRLLTVPLPTGQLLMGLGI